MRKLKVDVKTFRKLQERAEEKSMTVTEYVSSLVQLAEKVGK